MIGNVWEWVEDWWSVPVPNDAEREQQDPKGPKAGTETGSEDERRDTLEGMLRRVSSNQIRVLGPVHHSSMSLGRRPPCGEAASRGIRGGGRTPPDCGVGYSGRDIPARPSWEEPECGS